MEDEYIIISKTAIQKRIELLEKTEEDKNNQLRAIEYSEKIEDVKEIEILEKELSGLENSIEELKQIISQSTPLIPEIEKAFDIGSLKTEECYNKTNGFVSGIIHTDKQDYISNLKLDI